MTDKNYPRICSNCRSERTFELVDMGFSSKPVVTITTGDGPDAPPLDIDFTFLELSNKDTGFLMKIDMFRCRECGAIRLMSQRDKR